MPLLFRRMCRPVGRFLWTSLTDVVLLHRLMRQSDPVFQDLLTAVRNGTATDVHHALLLARVPGSVTAGTPDSDADTAMVSLLREAPVVVARNQLRIQLLLHTALRNGGRCRFSLPVDTLPKAPAALSTRMRQNLLLLSETSTGSLPGMLPLIVGDTYYLSKKIHHALSAVNGTECELTAVVPGQGQPLALVVRIRSPSRSFHLPMLPPNCLPLLPETATFAVPLQKLAPVSSGSVTIRRRQFALVHGSAITAHKAQGKTLERVVVDLREPPPARHRRAQPLPFGYVYTALSRARTLDQLAILAPFSATALRQPTPAPLLEHAQWLSERNTSTLAAANIPHAIDGAPLCLPRPTSASTRPQPGTTMHDQHLASLRAQSTHDHFLVDTHNHSSLPE
jgi:hypothetical protein